MIPVSYALSGDEAIYQGDTYRGPLITLPDLSSVGGPEDLSGSAVVSAQIRDASGDLVGSFDVDVEDDVARQVRPTMSPENTANVPATTVAAPLYWDLQVVDGSWVGTILKGKVKVTGQVTTS